jgi:hypothetical protein
MNIRSFFLFGLLVFTGSMYGQSLLGAWEAILPGDSIRSVVIITDGYQVATQYTTDGRFKSTNGGSWSLEGDQMTEVVEFDTENPDRVGSEVTFTINLTDETLSVPDGPTWTRIDDGTPGALNGAWLMSGRKRDGEIQSRDTNRPRKTMKILSGTRFQWIAYNTETKQFSGTGGGTYTTEDGKYTENIEFFSRDDSRVGASLEFDYELIDGAWHHSGLSSRGQPLYEIWSIREK